MELFSHKKEGNLTICNTVDKPWEHYYAQWDESNRGKQILYDFTYI